MGRFYSLSQPELENIECYIQKSIAAGIIRPSLLAAGTAFFFVE